MRKIGIAEILGLSHMYCGACGKRIGMNKWCDRCTRLIENGRARLNRKLKKVGNVYHETKHNGSVK